MSASMRGNAAVDVRLAWSAGGVELAVTNCGGDVGSGGGQPSVPTGSGYGLAGMTERVRAVGGTVAAHGLPDGGFRVSVTMPVAGARP